MPNSRIVFVGGSIASAVGNVHRIASQMDGRFTLVGGCFSRNPETNFETGRAWNLDPLRIYPDIDELIHAEKGRIDAVAVLTPVFSHADIITSLFNNGFNVISEKPLVSSVAEAKKLTTLAATANTSLLVTFNYTGYPMVRELRKRVLRGDFGIIQQVRLTMQQEGYAKRNSYGESIRPQEWRLEDREIPTVSLDLGMHVLQLQQYLVPQEPVSIISRMGSLGQFPGVIDDVDVMYKCVDGLSVHAWWSKAALGYANGLSVEIFGSEGSGRWLQMEPEVLKLRAPSSIETVIHRGSTNCIEAGNLRYNRFKAGHPDGFLEAFANIYVDIADELQSSANFDDRPTEVNGFTADQSLLLLRVLAAAVDSAKLKSEVAVPSS